MTKHLHHMPMKPGDGMGLLSSWPKGESEEDLTAMMVVNAAGRIVWANQACCDLLGVAKSHFLTCQIQEMLSPEEGGLLMANVRGWCVGKTPSVPLDLRFLTNDQDGVCVKLRVMGVGDTSGNPAQALCILEGPEDVAGIKLLFDFQRTALEMVALGGALCEVLNALCLQTEKMVPGSMSSVLLLDPATGTLHVGAGPSLPQEARKALDGMVPGIGAGSCGTAVSLGKMVIAGNTDTSPHWQELRDMAKQLGIAACWSIPIVSKNGQVIGSVALSHSQPCSPSPFQYKVLETVSFLMGIAIQRSRDEQDLRESQNRLEEAVRGSSDGLWDARALPNEPWYSPRTPVWYAPRFKELLGYREEEFPNVLESFASHLHPEDRDGVFERLGAHMNQGVPYDVEYRLRTKSGKFKWFNGRGQAVWNKAGKPLRMSGSIRDISARKEAERELADREQRLRRALEERTQISQDLHDHVLQSLYAVGLLVSAIKKPAKQGETDQVLHYVNQGIDQLNQAMGEIRQFITGLDSSRIVCEDFLSDVRSLSNSLLDVGGPTFEIKVNEEAVRVLRAEHRSHVLSVAREAMHNCLQHAQATQGWLSLDWDAAGSCVKLEIRDNGNGFEPAAVPKGGRGLVNMNARADRIGGTLRILSAPGNGACVILRIPQ